MTKDNNSKGIILIIIAMTLFAMQDSLIKYIFEKASLYEIFFGRYFVAAILLFSDYNAAETFLATSAGTQSFHIVSVFKNSIAVASISPPDSSS